MVHSMWLPEAISAFHCRCGFFFARAKRSDGCVFGTCSGANTCDSCPNTIQIKDGCDIPVADSCVLQRIYYVCRKSARGVKRVTTNSCNTSFPFSEWFDPCQLQLNYWHHTYVSFFRRGHTPFLEWCRKLRMGGIPRSMQKDSVKSTPYFLLSVFISHFCLQVKEEQILLSRTNKYYNGDRRSST